MKNNTKGFTLIELIICIVIFGIIGTFGYSFISGSSEGAMSSGPLNAVRTMGFSDARVVDESFFTAGFRGCSFEGERWYRVSAVNPSKQPVSVNVCCGIYFKGCTLRN